MRRHARPFRAGLVALAFATAVLTARAPQAPQPVTNVKFPQLSESDAREWLTYLSSDELQGREVFTEGYGLAAGYIADHLRQWGLTPLGDDGTYFQRVKQRGYQVTRNSTVTIDTNGKSRTFKHGDHVSFALLSGGNQTLSFSGIEAGNDFRGRNLAGKLVVLFPGGPTASGGVTGGRADALVQIQRAAAVLNFVPSVPANGAPPPAAPIAPGRGGRGRGGRGGSPPADVTTVERVDQLIIPVVNGDDVVMDALFEGAPASFQELRAKANAGETIAGMSVSDVHVTIAVDNTFTVVSNEFTENVVGMVEGTDSQLKSTYVFFGAHLDHVGYSHNGEPKGQVNTPIDVDPIWNGADDDGSGSTALLGIAKAFATGPKARRSVVFVWHAGEEAGLLGSRYMADFPVVPLEKIQVEFNIDMIGRNRDNRASEANTLYVIGADRISTDLHNLVVKTVESFAQPLTLDFEFNDPKDVNDFYTRSDHYSYASKGIPIAFFFTGTHPDYHANTDSVEKIIFPKLLRVAQLVYQAGFAVAATDKSLQRDNLGPRSGNGFHGLLEPASR